ncbi:MAG: hypothetical protein MUP81_00485 [Dehalococcoidia bacterium]|nr:hypothetical protein [Dehalococcoidia bacterium]
MAMTDAIERQQVYDKLGMKSWEIARAEAEYRRGSKLTEMNTRQQRFGTSQDVTLGKEFTEPSGLRRTFSDSGEQMAMTLPTHYTNDYSPQDQKKIEKLYQARSEAATDPEANEDERQQAIDAIDTQISRVPHIAPIMKEPTPQQKFEASIVNDTTTGQRGFYDPKTGKLNPLVDPKITQAKQEKRQEVLGKELALEIKNNEARIKEGEAGLDYDVMLNRAQWRVKAQFGELEESEKIVNPALNVLWENTMNSMWWRVVDRASESSMLKFRQKYIENAVENNGVSAADAGLDFMMRWNEAERNPDNKYNHLVAPFNKDKRRELQFASTGVKTEGDPVYGGFNPEGFAPSQREETIGGLRVGEGKVTVEGETTSTMDGIPLVKSDADYDTLPSGTVFMDPNGVRRKKP